MKSNPYIIVYDLIQYSDDKRYKGQTDLKMNISAYTAEDAIVQAIISIKNEIGYHSHIITQIYPEK